MLNIVQLYLWANKTKKLTFFQSLGFTNNINFSLLRLKFKILFKYD